MERMGILFDQKQQPLALCATLKRQKMATLRTLAVVLQSTCGQHARCGLVGGTPLSLKRGASGARPAQMPTAP